MANDFPQTAFQPQDNRFSGVTTDEGWTRPAVRIGPTPSLPRWFCPLVFGRTGLPAFPSEHMICCKIPQNRFLSSHRERRGNDAKTSLPYLSPSVRSRPANTSPCRACGGLAPPSECALPGGLKTKGLPKPQALFYYLPPYPWSPSAPPEAGKPPPSRGRELT
jgi:hypothetical protein